MNPQPAPNWDVSTWICPCWESLISQFYFIPDTLKWLRELLLKRFLLTQKQSGLWVNLVYKAVPLCSSTAVKCSWSSPALAGHWNNNTLGNESLWVNQEFVKPKKVLVNDLWILEQLCEVIAKCEIMSNQRKLFKQTKAFNKDLSQRTTKES